MCVVVGATQTCLGVKLVGEIVGTTSSGLMSIPILCARLDTWIEAMAPSGVEPFCHE